MLDTSPDACAYPVHRNHHTAGTMAATDTVTGTVTGTMTATGTVTGTVTGTMAATDTVTGNCRNRAGVDHV